MLSDVISFVKSRTGLADRATILREINFAWKEVWNSDDLPGSLNEISFRAANIRISLPWYVGEVRGVKRNWDRTRIQLNTPRPYYQDSQIWQSEFEWRLFGPQPLLKTIVNATTLDITIDDAEDENLSVVLLGPDDTAQVRREEVIFTPGVTAKTTTYRFTDLIAFTKSIVTKSDVRLVNSNSEIISIIPNLLFEANHQFVQIRDNCDINSITYCYDVLFKKTTPYLYFDEQPVPFQEVLMAKTLEWISMPKDEQISKTQAFAEKGSTLLQQFNNNERSTAKRLDIGRNPFPSVYRGQL